MDCKEFKNIVVELFDQEPDPQIKTQCEQHMAKCAGCRHYYDELSRVADMLRPHHSPVSTTRQPNHRWLQMAATFVGVLFVTGVALAAIHIVHHNVKEGAASPTQETQTANRPQQIKAKADTTSIPQPKLYDNVPLGEIFKELSNYYHIKVVYRTEDAHLLRLYYQWRPEYSLEKVMEMLNNFEWIQLQLENDTLFVTTTAIPAVDC